MRDAKMKIVMVALLALGLLLAQSAVAQAQGSADLSYQAVLTRAQQAVNPDVEYNVTVSQQIQNAQRNESPVSFPEFTEQATFTPVQGLKRTPGPNGRPNEATSIPKFLFDIAQTLDQIQELPEGSIKQEQFNNRSHFVLEGASVDKERGFALWVDAENFSVSKVSVLMQGRLVAEIDVQSNLLNSKFWLPSHVELHSTLDNSTVVLDYDDYEFTP
ncbi:MAG: hypothetical protein ABIK83_07810 [Candidatus Zixiibacteriota bacterium]